MDADIGIFCLVCMILFHYPIHCQRLEIHAGKIGTFIQPQQYYNKSWVYCTWPCADLFCLLKYNDDKKCVCKPVL